MKKEYKQIRTSYSNRERGVALIWTLLVSSILVVISVTMSILVIKELRISTNMDESTRAYLAAEAGMERALYRIKNEIKNNIDWCGNFNYSNQSLLGVLPNPEIAYTVNVRQVNIGCTPNREVEIESTGISRQTNSRKIKTKIKIVNDNSEIDRYDTDPGFSLTGKYYNPIGRGATIQTLSRPFLIQQFDLRNFEASNIGPNNSYFGVGMSTGNNFALNSTDFIVKFTRQNASIQTTLEGKVNTAVIVPINTFNFTPSSSDEYRARIEYSKNGSGIIGYTVVRAIVLKRNISGGQDKYECIANGRFTVYTGLNSYENNALNRVRISSSVAGRPSYDSANKNILVGQSVRLDDMAFWGRD